MAVRSEYQFGFLPGPNYDDRQMQTTAMKVGRQDEEAGPASPLSPASTANSSCPSTTVSHAAMGSPLPFPSPTPSNYLALADQTFTPLSMDCSSEFCFSDTADDDDQDGRAKELEKAGLLRATRSEKLWRMSSGGLPGLGRGVVTGRAGAVGTAPGRANTSTTPPGSAEEATPAVTTQRGAGLVSAVVQSFEALQATRAQNGYDLISTKINRAVNASGLVSPPSTASPALSSSPSPSQLSPSQPQSQPQLPLRPANKRRSANNIGGAVAAAGPNKASAAGAAASHDKDAHDTSSPQLLSDPTTKSAPSDGAKPRNPPHRTSDAAAGDPLPSTATPGTGATTLVRPTPVNSPPQTPRFPVAAIAGPSEPSIVRTSSVASLNLRHPTPDPNKRSRSGACLGNIAALEATAERLSMTSSIEDAIREEHEELKRSDSRRSSILRANSTNRDRKISVSDAGSVRSQALLTATLSRQSSVVDLNAAARLGGYSPAGYIMSPHPSLSGASGRLRSGSKTGSVEVPPVAEKPDDNGIETARLSEVGNGEDFPFLSRHGPGKMSTRSTRSNLSYVQSIQLDEPIGLTKEAFDEADRAASASHDLDEEEIIRASAYQHIEAQFAHFDDDDTHHSTIRQPMLTQAYDDLPSPRLQIHQPESHHLYQDQAYGSYHDDRPTTSASTATYQQAQNAFGDFDGVHCVPEVDGFPLAPEPEEAHGFSPPQEPMPLVTADKHVLPAPRPKSYFDPSTGQEMMYYPARVPAMLNLPPKLSKKPKAAARQMRRSQMVVSAMAQDTRESRVWLPDPLDGARGSRESLPFMGDLLGAPLHMAPEHAAQGDESIPARPTHSRQASETSTIHASAPAAQTNVAALATLELAAPAREIRRPQRLTGMADKRNTRATMLDGLPPQLRASAFFDLPAEALPKIEVQGGSAMDTLDSILDASASAPVSAFTDHVFAGKLGSEVYGTEKKKKKTTRKSHMMTKSADLDVPPSTEKRGSHFSLLGGRKKRGDEDGEDEWTTVGLDEDGTQRREQQPLSPNELAPDADERSSEEEETDEEEEEDEDGELYQGPPTTLLAELQLRKQQNKMRTRNVTQLNPNGLHSTLLELDAVAEVQRKARHGKRVNLAWEDPNANPDHNEDLDDDEVPLGMLYVAKANGMNRSTMDISAVMNEVHRPLGLMERRELEENEPLSRRRERLQGTVSGLIPPAIDVVQQRLSQLHPSPYGAIGLRSQSRLALPLPSPGQGLVAGDVHAPDDDEEEGETLAQRKARLAAENPLPSARPVSGAFSAELLNQFGNDLDKRPDSKGSKGKEVSGPTAGVPEEEETLGQRRRRLQAEREARDREFTTRMPEQMAMGNTLHPVQDDPRLSRRLSMADVLNAHPREAPQGWMDPREAERLQREAEFMRSQQEKEMKMAALRAQMPTTLAMPSHGARAGGYMNGAFNNGLGGTVGYDASPAMVARQQGMSMMPPAAGLGYGPAPGVASPYGGGMMNPGYGNGYGIPMQMNPQGTDMVERWRQGVMP